MTNLFLQATSLTGTIVDELGNCTLMKDLGLFSNELYGTIPTTLGLMTNLEALWLFDNEQLAGTVPTEFGNLNNLTILSEHTTNISDSVNSILCENDGDDDNNIYNNY